MDKKLKILIVEDIEIKTAKSVFKKMKTKIVETLKNGFEEINSGKYQILITDLYYPTGDIEFREGFNEKLGDAIFDVYDKCRDFNRNGSTNEIDFVQSIKNGVSNEIPSGALLGIYALLKTGTIPLWITSHEHHGYKSDFMTQFVRSLITSSIKNGYYKDFNDVTDRGYFIEGINNKGEKWWGEALSLSTTYDRKLSKKEFGKMLSDNAVMDLRLVQLALDLPRYLLTKNN